MNCRRIKAEPYMYFNCTIIGLMIWLSWFNDCVCFGIAEDVEDSHKNMKQIFECDDVGNMDKYVR